MSLHKQTVLNNTLSNSTVNTQVSTSPPQVLDDLNEAHSIEKNKKEISIHPKNLLNLSFYAQTYQNPSLTKPPLMIFGTQPRISMELINPTILSWHDQCVTATLESEFIHSPSHIRVSSLSSSNVIPNDDVHILAKLHLNQERADKRIIVFVNFEGEKYEALVDTGASVTCIRKDIILKHNKEISPVAGVITLADESLTIPRIGV
ncbi:hypothetical protein BX616_009050, partial [Lobosporangium transversale]